MSDILQQIVANKRQEIARQKEAISLKLMLAMGSERLERPTQSMRKALDASTSGIIAEFKRKSPSKGWLFPEAQAAHVVADYERAGASACSILTDDSFFGGSLGDLQKTRRRVKLPLLRKDFIIDDYQLYQARLFGADAVLLIAACLTKEQCNALVDTAHSLQLEVLLEIHREEELDYLTPSIDMLGVNNRNLGTFDTDVDNSFRLASAIEAQVGRVGDGSSPLLVAESGISDPATVTALRQAGFRGFLIGETFMKTTNPGNTLSTFIQEIV